MLTIGNPLKNRRLRRAAIASLAVTSFLILAASAHAYVYWSIDELGGDGSTIGYRIMRSNLDGHGVKTLAPYFDVAADLTLGGRYLFFWTRTGLGRVGIDGSDPRTSLLSYSSGVVPSDDGDAPGMLASDGTYVYWMGFATAADGSDERVIGRAKVDGTDANPSFVTLPNAGGPPIAVGGGYIYWTGSYDSGGDTIYTIGRANADGSNPDNTFITLPDNGLNPGQLAVDSSHLYWFNEDGGGGPGQTIGRANVDGSNVTPGFITLSGSGEEFDGLTSDNTHLYWGLLDARGFAGEVARADAPDGSGQFYLVITRGAVSGVGVDGYNGNQIPVVTATSKSKPTRANARCVVPKLNGLTLVKARRALTRAHCKLGRVTRHPVHGKQRGRVIESRPGAGRHLTTGARVALLLTR